MLQPPSERSARFGPGRARRRISCSALHSLLWALPERGLKKRPSIAWEENGTTSPRGRVLGRKTLLEIGEENRSGAILRLRGFGRGTKIRGMTRKIPGMKYCQLDRITLLEPGKKLVGERTLMADEEYLLDHFPRFPVMPGVMMLEALHQASVWLVRMTPGFQQGLVLLREVRNVKFGDFLSPGETLTVESEVFKIDGDLTTVKAVARKGDRVTVAARLILESCSSGDPEHLDTDAELKRAAEAQFFELYRDCPAVMSLRQPSQDPSTQPNE